MKGGCSERTWQFLNASEYKHHRDSDGPESDQTVSTKNNKESKANFICVSCFDILGCVSM